MKLSEIKAKIRNIRNHKKACNIPICWKGLYNELTEEEKADLQRIRKREDLIGYFLDMVEGKL